MKIRLISAAKLGLRPQTEKTFATTTYPI